MHSEGLADKYNGKPVGPQRRQSTCESLHSLSRFLHTNLAYHLYVITSVPWKYVKCVKVKLLE